MERFSQLFIALALICGISQANATMQSKTVSTTCYIFNQDKLTLKSKCVNLHSEGFVDVSTALTFDEYRIKGRKTIAVSSSANDDKSSVTLNDNEAVEQYRDEKSLKTLTQKQVDKIKSQKFLNCTKQSNNGFEICTPNLYRHSIEHGIVVGYGE